MAIVRAGIRRCGCLASRSSFTELGSANKLDSPLPKHFGSENLLLYSSRGFATSSIRRDQPVIALHDQSQPVDWATRSAFLLGTGATLALAAYFYFGRPPIEATHSDSFAPKPVKVTVGGAFNLVDQDGRLVTNQDFLCKWSLIYIGYTHCPEDCPRQLQKISEVIRQFEKSGQEIVPIFITADPERDNPNQLKKYLKEFHPKFVGLTGNPSDVRPVLWKFRAYFRKTDEDGLDYLVDHSSSTYLMNPKMECVRVFGPEYHVKSLIEAMELEMKITTKTATQ